MSFAIALLFLISSVSAVNVGDSCSPPGEYDIDYYCDFINQIQLKKLDGFLCSNNYECANNSCTEGACESEFKGLKERGNLLQYIWDAIMNFITGGGAVLCEDGDEDGYGDPASDLCENSEEDCDDDDSSIHPGATEDQAAGNCADGLDNDCDALIDCEDIECECDECEGSVATLCFKLTDEECGASRECYLDDTQQCVARPCNSWNNDELTCLLVEGCEWSGQLTIYCGNGIIEQEMEEQCDGSKLNQETCRSLGFDKGVLSCSSSCKFDTSKCSTTTPPGDECGPRDTRDCGPENETGICEFGTQLCLNGYWRQCSGEVLPRAEECNGLDDNCDGSLMQDEYAYSTGIEVDPIACSDGLDNDCDGMIDLNDVSCLPFCGNGILEPNGTDEIPGTQDDEECDMLGGVLNLSGHDCTNYTGDSDFTGGVLSCNAPGSSNECGFNISLCTVCYIEEDQEVSQTLNKICGLREGTTLNTEILTDLPVGIVPPENADVFFILNISADPQPPFGAEVFFRLNKTQVNNTDNIGWYLLEPDNNWTHHDTTLLGDDGVYYNYSAEIPHFSLFLITESLPYCGDGEVGPGEECDEDDLNGETCADLGYDSGELSCYAAGNSNQCLFNTSDCYTPDGDGNGNGNGNGNGGVSSINILIYSPIQGVTYSKKIIPLEVVDTEGRAGYWRYSLNDAAKIEFIPNSTISVQTGTNILKVYAQRTQYSSYGALEVVSFSVIDNPQGYCGDNICDEGEDPSSCPTDCGSYAYIGESYCGDGTCDLDETLSNCPADCKAKKKSKAGLFVFLIIILLAGIGVVVYFIYKRAKGRKSPGVSPPPRTRPPASAIRRGSGPRRFGIRRF